MNQNTNKYTFNIQEMFEFVVGGAEREREREREKKVLIFLSVNCFHI